MRLADNNQQERTHGEDRNNPEAGQGLFHDRTDALQEHPRGDVRLVAQGYP